jgi:hypothetical protein
VPEPERVPQARAARRGAAARAQLELARQRAIVTGRAAPPVWLELDQAEYRLEWLSEDPETAGVANVAGDEIDLAGNTPLQLAAPPTPVLDYQPIPGNFGRTQVVADPFYFEAVETPEGRITRGEVSIGFARDGTAEDTRIYLQDAQGDKIALDVLALDDRVRIRTDLDDAS